MQPPVPRRGITKRSELTGEWRLRATTPIQYETYARKQAKENPDFSNISLEQKRLMYLEDLGKIVEEADTFLTELSSNSSTETVFSQKRRKLIEQAREKLEKLKANPLVPAYEIDRARQIVSALDKKMRDYKDSFAVGFSPYAQGEQDAMVVISSIYSLIQRPMPRGAVRAKGGDRLLPNILHPYKMQGICKA